MLIDGGNVTLINVEVSNNSARGADGANSAGAPGSHAGPNGGNGSDAYGGGIYLTSGTLSLVNCDVHDNKAIGGNGGNAGAGQRTGGQGGAGGRAFGGGVYVAQTAAHVAVRQSHIDNNVAQGGGGGNGGDGGYDDNRSSGGFGGAGGTGGGRKWRRLGCLRRTLTLWSPTIDSNLAHGGRGGAAGKGGYGYNSENRDLCGGDGGPGGAANGGGLWVFGALSQVQLGVVDATVVFNRAVGGQGGGGGSGGEPSPDCDGGSGGFGGGGGSAAGGGVYLDGRAKLDVFGGAFFRKCRNWRGWGRRWRRPCWATWWLRRRRRRRRRCVRRRNLSIPLPPSSRLTFRATWLLAATGTTAQAEATQLLPLAIFLAGFAALAASAAEEAGRGVADSAWRLGATCNSATARSIPIPPPEAPAAREGRAAWVLTVRGRFPLAFV